MLGEARDWQDGAQSPIEDRLMIAMGDVAGWMVIRKPFWLFEHALDFAYRRLQRRFLLLAPQCRVARYRLDFAVFAKGDNNGLKIIGVECDGKNFHSSPAQMARDRERDAEIERLVGIRTTRFTGSEIRRSAEACAKIALGELFAFQDFTPMNEPTDLVDNGEWWGLGDADDDEA